MTTQRNALGALITYYDPEELVAYLAADPAVRKYPEGGTLFFWEVKADVENPLSPLYKPGEVVRNTPSSAETSEWKKVGGGSGSGAAEVFPENILVKLSTGETFGKYNNGDLIPAVGKSANEVILDALRRTINPAATLNGFPLSNQQEIGEVIDIILDAAYQKNDGGDSTGVVIRKDNNQIAASEPYTDTNVVMIATPKVYQAVYTQSGSPEVNAGTVSSNTLSYRGFHRYWYGAVAANPATGAEVRAYSGRLANAGNTWILNTGTVEKKYFFMLLPDQNLSGVVDLDALNLNITSEYTLIDNNFTGQDFAGNPIPGCKLYVKTQSVPYSTNHRHQITIS